MFLSNASSSILALRSHTGAWCICETPLSFTFLHEAFLATLTSSCQSTYQPLFLTSAASAKRSLHRYLSFSFLILSPMAAHLTEQSLFYGLRYIGSGACVTCSKTIRPHCLKKVGRKLIDISDRWYITSISQGTTRRETSRWSTDWGDLLVLYKSAMVEDNLGMCIIAFLRSLCEPLILNLSPPTAGIRSSIRVVSLQWPCRYLKPSY